MSAGVSFSPAEAHAMGDHRAKRNAKSDRWFAEGRLTPADQRECHDGGKPLPECGTEGREECAAALQPCKRLSADEVVSPEELDSGAISPGGKLPNCKLTCMGTASALGAEI